MKILVQDYITWRMARTDTSISLRAYRKLNKTEATQPPLAWWDSLKNFSSSDKNFSGPPRGSGDMLPQKSLKIKFLRLAKNAFPGIFLLVKQL